MSIDRKLEIFVAFVLCVNIFLWFSVRFVQSEWTNVPPAPDKKYSSLSGLGDPGFAYRTNALMIQNFGDTGGRFTPLKDYDYDALTEWMFLQDHLDEQSNFMPYLAAYYFSGVQEPEMFRPMLYYLQIVGAKPYADKWRWLAQGVFLARFILKDLDRALELAKDLNSLDDPDIPNWARQISASIMSMRGEKEAAYELMLGILQSSAKDMHPNEVYSMRIYMCNKLLDREQALKNPLCEGIELKE